MITSEDYEVLESAETDDAKVEILQFGQLAGSADVRAGTQLATIKRCDMKLKMIRVTLKKESHVRVEPGGLYYMKGNLEIKASTGGGIVKGLFRMTSGETFFVSQIHGVGEIYLEPTFGHFFLHRIDGSEGGVICDKGMFYAGTSGLDISATSQKSLSAGMFGGEGGSRPRSPGRASPSCSRQSRRPRSRSSP